ncbi:hypothetical protein BU23DRAFT_297642 [Bimuria novae-zelandiae CBS 107.79]|uniref:Uncharacterized protein n=1 Tax=Bimuria novae-zelandiae CBS 107.79 TaxID=1447943 RepID=A0A6A5VJT0_9PLEO|nr:hypothetical protein BU23DRAFT_297642 [Bimuria novae-zelandiae CBS 107.79]
MRFLDWAIREHCDEVYILQEVRWMVSEGANPNARSRTGSTILHFGAEAALPDLVAFALSEGAQVDLRDNHGFTALDYAAGAFNRSRVLHQPPELTGRSLKSAAKLLDKARLPFRKAAWPSRMKGPQPSRWQIASGSHTTARRLLQHGASPMSVADPDLQATIHEIQTKPFSEFMHNPTSSCENNPVLNGIHSFME